jgi:hypothetical protein
MLCGFRPRVTLSCQLPQPAQPAQPRNRADKRGVCPCAVGWKGDIVEFRLFLTWFLNLLFAEKRLWSSGILVREILLVVGWLVERVHTEYLGHKDVDLHG